MKKFVSLVLIILMLFSLFSCKSNKTIDSDYNGVQLIQHHEAGTYKNHCWKCGASINSNNNRRCSECGWYICNNCGACEYDCPRYTSASNNSKSSSSGKKDYSWIWIVLIIGAGIFLYKRYKENKLR